MTIFMLNRIETQSMKIKKSRPKSSPHSFFAVISDIHANIDALDAVLADVEQWQCRGILCLGDIVGYGPEPATCVQRVMDVCAVSVFGNHEAMLFLADQFPTEELGEVVGDPLALAVRQLSEEQMKWLRGLPITTDLDPMMLSHAALNDIGNFLYIDDSDGAKAHFAAQTTHVSFQGHSHVPVIWEEKKGKVACFDPTDKPVRLDEAARYAVNVGSVGQPRDGDPRACYALYDYQNRILLHRRVQYDINAAQARFKKTKLPAVNASRNAVREFLKWQNHNMLTANEINHNIWCTFDFHSGRKSGCDKNPDLPPTFSRHFRN